ncbi:MAG: uroporphyrinogen decarboxylase [Chloroflexota bacterium]
MNDTFLKACRGEKTAYTPVWVMRQAGRNLPQFRELNAKVDFLSLCRSPELAARITMMPVDTFGVDAAILFSDLPLMVVPMGIELKYTEKLGPVYPNPIRSKADVDRLVVADPEAGLSFMLETIRLLLPELKNKVPLIGFGGCPFTLAAYMVEGGVSQRYFYVKSMINEAPELFHALMAKITKFDAAFLRAQLKAGAQAVMMFESWGGILSHRDYMEFAYPYVKEIITSLKKEGKPVIYFPDRGGALLEQLKDCGADVFGIDFRVRLDDAIKRLGPGAVVQGNLDPYVMMAASQERMETQVREILTMGAKARGHIFNLGDGIQPETPVAKTKALVETVHRLSRKT